MTRLPTSMLLCLVPVVVFVGCRTDRDQEPSSGAGTTAAQAASPPPQGEAAPQAAPEPIFLPPGEGRVIEGVGEGPQGRLVFKLGGGESGSTFEFAQDEVQPNSGPPEHIHFETDEAFYVANGTFRVKVGERIEDVGPGSFVFAPRGVPHGFVNTGQSKGILLIVTSPPNFEANMREATEALQRTPPDQKTLDALSEKYKVRIVGPPLGNAVQQALPRNP